VKSNAIRPGAFRALIRNDFRVSIDATNKAGSRNILYVRGELAVGTGTVTVTLPDNSTGDGTITAVGSVATASTNSGASNGNNQPSATVNVTVALSHASPAGSLDQAPVTVNITNQSVQQTLAVPTTALLALAGGGYAVEVVDPDGVHHLVGVTTGLFDDQAGLVQVSGSGLDVGQKVVVAQ
jgi:hypothetical protein